MELRENECRIYYKGEETFIPFDKELKQLFEDNGWECWASGFNIEDGIREIYFEKIVGDNNG